MNPRMKLIDLPRANSLDRSRDDLVGILRKLVHRLSQPLTFLRGSTELALMGDLKELECRRVLEQSLDEFHRTAEILGMLRDVLEMESSIEDFQPVSWTQTVEESLKSATFDEENSHRQVVCDVADEVWVKGSPHHLDTATRRLIDRAVKLGQGNRVVRVSLFIQEQEACLSVDIDNESSFAGTELPGGRNGTCLPSSEPEDLDWWIVRRAIELQGGGLRISRTSRTPCCYQLFMPLVRSEVAGTARSS